jgi:riboflavin kinase/FMN adenylyltransferase
MKVTPLPEAQPHERRVAVGVFDGVHLGHRQVIDGCDTVLTFDPHPTKVIAPDAAPRLLTTIERKAELVASLGVEEMVVIPFDRSFASQSPQDFIADVLVERLGARFVSVGENFRFGHKAQGDPALLAADERFDTRVVELLEIDGEIVSSSHIRGLILGGAVDYAGRLLGAPFTMTGPVVHGDKRGRELGFPTANVVPHDGYVTPGHGVYACLADERPAAVSVGVRPQFKTGRHELVEAYLLDFDGDLYDQPLRIDFRKRLRGERRFPTVEDLVEQMHRDVDDVRCYFAG